MPRKYVTGKFCTHCTKPRFHRTYCKEHHYLIRNVSQKRRRRYRAMLGLCFECTSPNMPGHSRCAKHYKNHVRDLETRKERKYKKQGWRMMKVKV